MNLRPGPRITSPGDLLALVPTVLGFHPGDSLVLVVVAGDAGHLHARVDLLGDDEEEVEEVLQTLLSAATRARARLVAVIAYSDDAFLCEEVVNHLVDRLRLADVEVLCAIRADDERWYSLDWSSVCAPDEGVPYDLSSHPITAQAVLEGRVTFGCRRDLEDSLVGTDLEAIEAVEGAADEAMRRLEQAARDPLGLDSPEGVRAHLMTEGFWVRQRVRRHVQAGEPLDDDEVGRAGGRHPERRRSRRGVGRDDSRRRRGARRAVA